MRKICTRYAQDWTFLYQCARFAQDSTSLSDFGLLSVFNRKCYGTPIMFQFPKCLLFSMLCLSDHGAMFLTAARGNLILFQRAITFTLATEINNQKMALVCLKQPGSNKRLAVNKKVLL